MPLGRLDKLRTKDIRERVPLAVDRSEAHPFVEDQPLQAVLTTGSSEILAVKASLGKSLKPCPSIEHAVFRKAQGGVLAVGVCGGVHESRLQSADRSLRFGESVRQARELSPYRWSTQGELVRELKHVRSPLVA
ncbi:MAG: hypothetical protein ACHQHO_08395 [Solirubrobacterales bacterium]